MKKVFISRKKNMNNPFCLYVNLLLGGISFFHVFLSSFFLLLSLFLSSSFSVHTETEVTRQNDSTNDERSSTTETESRESYQSANVHHVRTW